MDEKIEEVEVAGKYLLFFGITLFTCHCLVMPFYAFYLEMQIDRSSYSLYTIGFIIFGFSAIISRV